MLQIPNFNSIKLCLSICGYDGLISDIELDTLYSLYNKKNGITRDQFDEVVDNYFNSNESLDELFAASQPLSDEMEIAHKAAGSDGLDIRENIALKICTSMLSIKED
jgi:hypothetical protein